MKPGRNLAATPPADDGRQTNRHSRLSRRILVVSIAAIVSTVAVVGFYIGKPEAAQRALALLLLDIPAIFFGSAPAAPIIGSAPARKVDLQLA